MKDGLIFANARAKAKELNLFTEERLHRMMESKTLDEAVRILIEVNYAGGMVTDANNFYDLLNEEERIVTSFVREVAPANIGFECLFMRNDYHNIKVLLKAKYGKIGNIDDMFLPDGNIKLNDLKTKAENNTFDFNPFIIQAVAIIDKAFESGKMSPRIIDTEIDKAMYKDINNKLQQNSDKYIKEYFVTLIDSINIATYLRTVKIKATYAFFESNYIEGGTITAEQFKGYNMDTSKLAHSLAGTQYKVFFDKIIDNDMSAYETAQDNYLLKIFATNKTDMFSVAPIVGYYLAKLNEIKVIRVVLVCIKNKVPSEEMKKRVRELYV